MKMDKLATSSTDALTDIPVTLLESFLPGFGIIRRLLVASTGIDITTWVSACFIIFAFVSAARYVWRYCSRQAMYWLSSTITISSRDKLHEQVTHWIASQALAEKARSLTAVSRIDEDDLVIDGDEDGPFRFVDRDQAKAPLYVPAYGRHHFWHNGRLFFLQRDLRNQHLAALEMGGGDDDDREVIKITTLGRSTKPIKRLLLECKKTFAEKNKGKTTVKRPAMYGKAMWNKANRRPSRPMETIYLDETIKAEFLDDVHNFLKPSTNRFYGRMGFPYRRGYLFHGAPGTGKTSLSFALAGVLGLELYALSLSDPKLSDTLLSGLLANLPARSVVIIEDVDAAGLERRNLQDDDDELERKMIGGGDLSKLGGKARRRTALQGDGGVTLSGLLNAIDGVASTDGRILIMTTNDPETLDKALIRPGRVDMQVYFGCLNKANAEEIFYRMFLPLFEDDRSTAPRKTAKRKIEESKTTVAPDVPELRAMAQQFANAVPEQVLTPAEVQGFLLPRRFNPQKALGEFPAWRDSVVAAKTAGKNIISKRDRTEATTDTESGNEFQEVKKECD